MGKQWLGGGWEGDWNGEDGDGESGENGEKSSNGNGNGNRGGDRRASEAVDGDSECQITAKRRQPTPTKVEPLPTVKVKPPNHRTHQITKPPNHQITKSPNHRTDQTTKPLPNDPTTKSPNHNVNHNFTNIPRKSTSSSSIPRPPRKRPTSMLRKSRLWSRRT